MTELKPEERARQWIDRKPEDAGWQVGLPAQNTP